MPEETKLSVDAQKEKKPGKIKGFFSKIGKFIKKHKVLLVIIIIIIAAVIFFMVKKSQKQAASQTEAPVMTTELTKMDLQKSVSVTGTLKAGDTASVTSTLNGVKITTVNYEVGDYVEAGATVVVFDGDDYNTKLAELNAKYNISDKQSAHSIEQYQDQIEEYQKQITEDQEYLDKYKSVYENLLDAKAKYIQYKDSDASVVTRWQTEQQAAQQLDDAVSIEAYEAKEDEIEDLQDKIEEAQYNIELAQLQQEYDKDYTQTSEYDNVYDNMDNTTVTAPISGYITAMNVEEGNSYTMGSTIFTISDTSSFVVEATVDEYDVASISKGQKAVVKFDSTDDDEFSGQVTYIAIATGSSDSSSSTLTGTSSSSSSSGYTLKITLDSVDDRLRVGMTAKGSVILESVEDVFAVPYDCIETDEDGNSYVTQVADDGTETKITVTVGLQSDYYEEIQSSQLTEGMQLKATASSSDSSSSDNMMIFDMSGGEMGGAPGGGDMGGGPGGGF